MEQVERIQNKLTEALQNMINLNHKEDSTLFAKLLMKTTDLRTLNTLHSERSIGGHAAGFLKFMIMKHTVFSSSRIENLYF